MCDVSAKPAAVSDVDAVRNRPRWMRAEEEGRKVEKAETGRVGNYDPWRLASSSEEDYIRG